MWRLASHGAREGGEGWLGWMEWVRGDEGGEGCEGVVRVVFCELQAAAHVYFFFNFNMFLFFFPSQSFLFDIARSNVMTSAPQSARALVGFVFKEMVELLGVLRGARLSV